MKTFYSGAALAYFIVATILLMAAALILLGNAVWQMATSFGTGRMVDVALDSIGLMIIGFAVVETAKFIAEEEILRDRELRSSMESRRSITKFTTIIVIAVSLEALVMVFKANETSMTLTLYPALLLATSMFALIALGIYQFLSSRIEPASQEEKDEAESGEETLGKDDVTGNEPKPRQARKR